MKEATLKDWPDHRFDSDRVSAIELIFVSTFVFAAYATPILTLLFRVISQ